MFNPKAIDGNAKKNGVWKEYQGSEFLIRPTNNGKFAQRMTMLTKDLKGKTEDEILEEDPDKLTELYCEALVGTVLLDWRKVEGDLEFTEELAKSTLEADDDFRNFVMEQSNDLTNFRREAIEATVKK